MQTATESNALNMTKASIQHGALLVVTLVCIWKHSDAFYYTDDYTTAYDRVTTESDIVYTTESDIGYTTESDIVTTRQVDYTSSATTQDVPFIRVDACDRDTYEFCDIGMISPDEWDCNFFYGCDLGHWVHHQCPPFTGFDNITYTCRDHDYVCHWGCYSPTGTPLPDPFDDPSGPCPGVNEHNCEVDSKYPDARACDWYHLCVQGGPMVELQCSYNTVFDLDIASCVMPDSDFYCFPRCPEVSFPPDHPETTTQFDENPSFTRVTACEKAEYQFCDVDMMAYDDTSCQLYYVCDGGFWRSGLCQEPTVFDIESFACRPVASATCSDDCPPFTGAPHPDPSLDPAGPCPEITGDNCEPQQNYPDRRSCSHYHHCVGSGTIIEAPCPENTFYNLEDQQCQAPDADFNCYRECEMMS